MNLTPEPAAFRKSSYSKTNNCVEVATLPTGAAVRDTKHRDRGHLAFDSTEWCALVNMVRANRL